MEREGELPMPAAGDAVLFGTADAGGWLGSLRVYSRGFVCALRVIRRVPQEPVRVVDGRRVPRTVWDGEGGLRLGVRYGTGGRAGELSGERAVVGRDERRPLAVRQLSGSGTPGAWDAQLWIAPLPTGGSVLVSGSWRDAGVEEFGAELDGEAIASAAAGVTRLWGDPGWPGGSGGASGGVLTVGTVDVPGDVPGGGPDGGPGDGGGGEGAGVRFR